jgi:ribosomal protein S18 acetylase RimI-like enzyme
MILIKDEVLTEELKHKVFQGFSKHAIEQIGFDELLQPIAFIAYNGNEFAGTVVVQLFWGALHIKYLYVEEAFRGQSAGKALMLHALEYGKMKNCPFAFVETMNFQAPEFYKKLGFKIDFIRDGYSHGTSFHYLKMEL